MPEGSSQKGFYAQAWWFSPAVVSEGDQSAPRWEWDFSSSLLFTLVTVRLAFLSSLWHTAHLPLLFILTLIT